MLAGVRGGSMSSHQLLGAARLAHRFAFAYARSVYRRRPPHLPGASAALSRHLATAATRVPPVRRARHPRPLALSVEPRGRQLRAAVKIGDGRSPVFSVAFTIKRRRSRWRVVAISPPG
jgi:hypothetical protein